MSEQLPGPERHGDGLSDTTPEDMFTKTPSEESAIQFAETMSVDAIRNEIARLSAEKITRQEAVRIARGQLEATDFALSVFTQALMLADDKNPGV